MNNYEEKVVAVIEPQTAVGEDELAVQVTDIEIRAEGLVVSNDDEYKEAGELGRLLKAKMAEVTEFFAPMKKSAHDAHKQVCDREKQMLSPLKNAEAVLKKSMGAYALKKEQERKAAEEAARRLAQEEAERKLQASIDAEASGNVEAAKAAMLDAEIADNASRMVSMPEQKLKAEGVGTQKDWEITAIDASKVPVSLAGMVIRPVDEAAVMKLIRASKGTIQIEGISYQETIKMSFRR